MAKAGVILGVIAIVLMIIGALLLATGVVDFDDSFGTS